MSGSIAARSRARRLSLMPTRRRYPAPSFRSSALVCVSPTSCPPRRTSGRSTSRTSSRIRQPATGSQSNRPPTAGRAARRSLSPSQNRAVSSCRRHSQHLCCVERDFETGRRLRIIVLGHGYAADAGLTDATPGSFLWSNQVQVVATSAEVQRASKSKQ